MKVANRTPIFDRLCAERGLQPTARLDLARLSQHVYEVMTANFASLTAARRH